MAGERMAMDKGQAVKAVEQAGWHASYGTYLSGRAALDGVDALATEMERKWGCDRLRLLLSDETREKFDRQRVKLNHAIRSGELIDIQREAARMTLAWHVADTEATMRNALPLAPNAWEVVLPDGSVAVLVQGNPEANAVLAQGRQLAVYTLEEVAQLLHHYQTVKAAKLTFPGATVFKTRLPLDPLRQLGDGDLTTKMLPDDSSDLG
jgi:hypothetical protein